MNHENWVLLAQQEDQGGGSPIGMIVVLLILVFILAGVWKTFTKAGKPGWAAIIPIYNVYLFS